MAAAGPDQLGDPVWHDEFLELPQQLDLESNLQANLEQECAAAKDKALPETLRTWREWTVGDGISHAERLRDVVRAVVREATELELYKDSVGAAGQLANLQAALDKARNGDAGDSDLNAFMGIVPKAYEAMTGLRDRVRREELRGEQLAEATAWAMAYGSPRLSKAISTDVMAQMLGAYRDERLERERPHWSWWNKDAEPVRGIINPSERDLDTLLAARKVDPRAQLAFMPDAGPVVTSAFLDRPIYMPTSDYPGYAEEPF